MTAVAPLPTTTTFLPGIVQVLRPILGMDQRPLEGFLLGEMGAVGSVVAIIAGAAMQEAALVLAFLAAGKPRRYKPSLGLAAPFHANDPAAVSYPFVDAVFFCGVANVLQDIGAIGYRLAARKRLKAVSERVHVRVATDARIPKKIPCATRCLPALQDDHGLAGAIFPEPARSADAGQASADNDHVEIFNHRPPSGLIDN